MDPGHLIYFILFYFYNQTISALPMCNTDIHLLRHKKKEIHKNRCVFREQNVVGQKKNISSSTLRLYATENLSTFSAFLK